MRRIFLVGLVVAALGAALGVAAVAAGERKVTICHVPPGNTDKAITLTIGESAVPAHLANHAGDSLGACSTVFSGSN